MEVCRLCLDLVATQGGAKLLDGETRDMVQVVAPELNLEASKEPHTCAECQRTLTRLFEFKSRVFEREAEVRAAVGTRRGKFGLKEALEGGDAKGTPSATTDPGGGEAPPKAKDRVCRTCLAPIECESFTVLRPSEPDAYLSSMLDVCLVEVDLELTLDPVMCEACLEQLQRLHHFRSACRDVEEKIVAFREGGGAGAGPVDLHTVLGAAAAAAPDVEMVTVKEEDEGAAGSSGAVPRRGGRKRVKVEPAKAEPVKEEEEDEEDDESEEEEDDEDEDMSDGDEDDPDGELKQEELDIKSETGTSDSDSIFTEPSHFNYDEVDTETEYYKCPCCKHETSKKPLHELHMRRHYKKGYSMHCDKCAFEVKSPIAFKRHLAKIHGDATFPLFKCSKCDYSSITQSHLKNHERRHIPKGKKFFICELCGNRSRSRRDLMHHLYSKHQVKDKDVEPFKCPHCPYMAYHVAKIKKHARVHEEERFDCDKCLFKGRNQQELVKHQVDVHGYEPPFKCPHCPYMAQRLSSVKRHTKIHEDGRFDCDKCVFKGTKQDELVKHQTKVHDSVSLFKCSFCPFAAHLKTLLRQHIKSHEQGRFDCKECPFKGSSQKKLVEHQVKQHDYQLPFKCSKCKFCSSRKQCLQRHEQRKHRD